MTSNLLYAVGTLLTWVGWAFAFRALLLGATAAFSGEGSPWSRGIKASNDGSPSPRAQGGTVGEGVWAISADSRTHVPTTGWGQSSGRLLVAAALAGLCLLAASVLPMSGGADAVSGTWRFPLVWFVMPWTAWLGVAALAMLLVRGAQAALALNADERLARLKGAAGWIVALVVFVALYRADPTSAITTLKGGIALAPATAAALGLLAVAAVVGMVLSARSLATRGLAKALVVQAALIVGSLVFGLPFAFAIVTSFKEDKDMSSPNGIVWVPRVSDTVPYMDPSDPLYEGRYDGQTVQGHAIPGAPPGRTRIDIQKPLAIRGTTFDAPASALKAIPVQISVVKGSWNGKPFEGEVVKEEDDGRRLVAFTSPAEFVGKQEAFAPADVENVRHVGLRWQNYPDAISYLPPETDNGLVYLKNTLVIVIMTVVGTVLSSSIVSYAFSRLRFPGKEALFSVLLATMMLPGAVTLMPRFLIFRWLGWIDTLYPLWVPAFFASAFNVFLLRQFFMQIPMELEDAAKIDGCGYLRTFWGIMMPQIKPALAVIAIWTFMGSWNDFMGPLIYVSSPENMPLSYALSIFKGDRGGEPGMLMALTTLCMIPVLALFFFAQRYFIEGVTLSGLGGR